MQKGIKEKDVQDFKKHANALATLIERIREYCPEANYYQAMDSLHLMCGESHKYMGTHIETCQENSVAWVHIPHSDGGDW